MDVKMTIDAQYLVESYTRQIKRDSEREGKIESVSDKGAHLLLVIDNESPIEYRVRFGGKKSPETTLIRGYAIPLILNYEIPLAESCDHFWGCERLDYNKEPELVEKYVEKMTIMFNYNDAKKKLYMDYGLKFTIPKEYYSNIYEGILPVMVEGESVMGPKFDKPTKAFIITGNCV